MKLIEFNDINQNVKDKIENKVSSFSPNAYMFFTDDNNNYIGISRNQTKNIIILKKNDPVNIKNSIFIIGSTYSIEDMFKEVTVENCFIYSQEFNISGKSRLFNSNIISKYEMYIKESFIFKSDIVSDSDLTISKCVITNLIVNATQLVEFLSCNIQDSTIKSDYRIKLNNYKIIVSEIVNSIIQNESITTPMSIVNCKIENSFINFSKTNNSIKNKNLSNDILYDNIDITSDFNQFITDIYDIINKNNLSDENLCKTIIYKKNNMIVVRSSFLSNGMLVLPYTIPNKLKNIFDGDVIHLHFNTPFDIEKVKLGELFEFFLNDHEVIPFGNILKKSQGKTYFLNKDFIKEYKGIFKPTVKQSFVIESDDNGDEYTIFVVNTDVYAIKVNKHFTEKMNSFLIGRFTSPLDVERILFIEDSMILSEILDLLENRNVFFDSLNLILKGNFNIVKNDMYDSNNDCTIVFKDGQINLTDANFLSIISENNYNTNIISFDNIKNHYDYKKFITHMGEYNNKTIKWKSAFIKGLTFSHNYNYFLTDKFIFIIWDVNPEVISIIEKG